MTAAEADARFEALISDYRRDQGGRKRGGRHGKAPVAAGLDGRVDADDDAQPANAREATDATIGTLVVVIVFGLGVACGAIWPQRPFAALLIGVPLILIGRTLLRRWRRDGTR